MAKHVAKAVKPLSSKRCELLKYPTTAVIALNTAPPEIPCHRAFPATLNNRLLNQPSRPIGSLPAYLHLAVSTQAGYTANERQNAKTHTNGDYYMEKEAEIKDKIYRAIREANITHGQQTQGDKLWKSIEESKVIGDAVFAALHKAGLLNFG